MIDSTGTYGNQQFGTATGNQAALVFSNQAAVAFAGATGARTLTLQGSSTGDNQINLQLTDNNSPSVGFNVLGVTKAGTGLWILGGTNNTYTGPTTVTGGILRAQDGSGIPSGIASNVLGGVTTVADSSTTDLSVDNANGLAVGQTVTGTGIAPGTTIAAVLDSKHIRLSAPNGGGPPGGPRVNGLRAGANAGR